jgi:hypothetical protein
VTSFDRTGEQKPEPARCRGCAAEIYFLKTESGADMPVDRKRASVVTLDGRVVQGYPPHWGSCPARQQFKRPTAADKKQKGEVSKKEAQQAFAAIREKLGDEDPK